MEFMLFSALNGVVYGLLLFMVSAGLTLIFGMMGIVNFAHASFYMLGAYFAYTLGKVVGFWPAIILSPIAVALIGAASIVSAAPMSCCSPCLLYTSDAADE